MKKLIEELKSLKFEIVHNDGKSIEAYNDFHYIIVDDLGIGIDLMIYRNDEKLEFSGSFSNFEEVVKSLKLFNNLYVQ